jgi:hypothetical protein
MAKPVAKPSFIGDCALARRQVAEKSGRRSARSGPFGHGWQRIGISWDKPRLPPSEETDFTPTWTLLRRIAKGYRMISVPTTRPEPTFRLPRVVAELAD